MNTESQQISFKLLKRTYQVSCPPAQRKSLDAAIRYLKSHIDKVHAVDKDATMDRIAVVTALNLSHEHLQLTQEIPNDLEPRLAALSKRAQSALDLAKQANLA